MPLSDDELRILEEVRKRSEQEHAEFQAKQEADRQARIAEEARRRAEERPHSGPTW
ncbi:hypothetical protein [Streptomyces sp. VRA16 Mangrove soil]|uniref:hypothetical protein n=1 Tax=Streptomyces sp. VRA16 Mangrove soil TaxID=2817434 RepID=UPI001A9F7181|nr:hypothetical protein [Streptomyces sp. VRA16 Mangrove soil]MBO1332611.1 hypothetical protein [Streptomyces sp. VRA16 Mangrove soil]